MSPYLLILPAALCGIGCVWQASEAAYEWNTRRARIQPSYAGVAQAALLSVLCFCATIVSLVPVVAHSVALGGGR
jgi:hypothetical protein